MIFFWLIAIAAALLTYVILDGYDLGIGTLTLLQPDAASRRVMLEVVGNVWDGNESWLILIAMGLWGGMPDVFATALPGLYLPLLLMIFAYLRRPALLLLDEPTEGLDRGTARTLLAKLRSALPGSTIVAAIHDRTLDHLPAPPDVTVTLAAGRVLTCSGRSHGGS